MPAASSRECENNKENGNSLDSQVDEVMRGRSLIDENAQATCESRAAHCESAQQKAMGHAIGHS